MKKIQLNKITIRNFKGFTDFTMEIKGEDVDIYGDNDAGKTSIYDAFLWCLFHKDSKDRFKINWQPLDSNNRTITGLTTKIAVELLVDGKIQTFEKQITNKKVIRRKNNEEVFENQPKYLVNGLETSTREMYDSKVAEILDQETFKNLTSVTYFCEQLDAEERREKLFNYFGTLTDMQIIQQHDNLKPLFEIVGSDTINDARAKIVQELKGINETLKSIPTKIEGIQAAMPEINDLNRDALVKDREKLSEEKSNLQDQLMTIKNGGAINEYTSKLRTKEEELKAERLSYETNQNAKINGIQQGKAKLFAELDEAKKAFATIEAEKESVAQKIAAERKHIEQLDQEHEQLTEKYDAIDDIEFMPGAYEKQPFDETQLVCFHCKRTFEAEQQEEMRQHHEEEEHRKAEEFSEKQKAAALKFEEDKELQLDTIRNEGIANNKEREETESVIKELEIQLDDDKAYHEAKGRVAELQVQMDTVSKQISTLESGIVSFEKTGKYEKLQKEIVQLNEFIAVGNEDLKPQITAQETLINDVEQDIAVIDEKLATFKEYDRQNAVIEDFNNQERDFSARKGELTAHLVLFEEFFITKQNLLEERINSHFAVVKWKLFDFYEEGGLNENFCEPVINGVPFRGLNNGSRMQAGLDVSNTLMKMEGNQVPIFIDNAEGLTSHKRNEVPVETQVIAMYVSEEDKNLRIIEHVKKLEGVA